jgi:prophage tail gpP-like protein
MAKIITVKQDDTLNAISRREYGDPSKYMTIFAANPQLRSGDPNLIYPGELLYIPDDEKTALEDTLKQQTIDTENIDDISVFINGVSIPLPDNYDIEIFFDTCADIYKMTFPFTYNNQDITNLFKPYGLEEVKIFMGKDLLFTGKQEVIIPRSQQNSINIASSGRSKPYLLIKSNVPNNAYPLERDNLKLDEILTTWILPIFGLQLQTEADVGKLFERVALNPTDLIWQFLSNLATQRNVVISNTPDGKVLITEPDLSNLVASFEQGKTAGIENIEITYDCNNRFGNWIGNSQSPGNIQNNAEFQDSTFNELSYKVLTLPETTAADIDQALKFQATKSVRDALTFPLIYPGWINPQNNQVFKAGEIINIKSQQIQLRKGFNFLIRSILYKKLPNRKVARFNFIPPQAYTGELITNFPWD